MHSVGITMAVAIYNERPSYRMIRTLKALHVFELNLFEFKSHLNSEMR